MKREKYRQIASELAAEIASGKYALGEIFPVREILAARFGVTKATLNRAMDLLIAKGILAARRGSGTVVVSTERHLDIAYVAPDWLMRHIPAMPGGKIKYFSYDDIFQSRSTARLLNSFDGILWSHPAKKHIKEIIRMQELLPSIIINRPELESAFVATDPTEPFKTLVLERLERHPDTVPILLRRTDSTRYIHDTRFNVFVAACRECRRFYETIQLPENFTDKIATLEQYIDLTVHHPLLIFADDWSHTGAVVRWGQANQLQWQKDLLYTDFDNTEPEHVFGMTTTSILQDFAELTQVSLERLCGIIRSGSGEIIQEYVSATLRSADT